MVLQSNRRGTVSYAMAGPNTRTTQLFVNLRDNHHLDKSGFAPFGEVVSGMDVLLSIFNPTPNDAGGVSQAEYTDKGNSWILEQYPEIDLIENTAMFEGEINP
jgi:peptidyl-prolyl cis-trans isomerase A (cyclophilin A)